MNDEHSGDTAGADPIRQPPATLVGGGDHAGHATVRFERDLPDPPSLVWRALTDPQELKSWFPCEVRVQRWQVGATLWFAMPGHPEYDTSGTVLELDEPRLLTYTWGEETLRFELAETDTGGTRLVLYDRLSPAIAARNAAGWQLCLERLAGRATADYAWKPLFARYSAAFAPALGPQQGPPAGFEDQA